MQNAAPLSGLKKPNPVGKHTQLFGLTATQLWLNTTRSENQKPLGRIAGDCVQKLNTTEYRNTESNVLFGISEWQQQHVEQ